MSFSKWLDHRVVTASKYVLAVGVSLVACVTPTSAQENQQLTRPKVESKFIFGSATFGEDIEHKLVGSAVRVYLTKRLSFEPEYLYLRNTERDQDQLFQANIAYDFTDPRRRLVLYGIAGAGVLKHKGRFVSDNPVTREPESFDNSFRTWTLSVGGGAKIYVTKRFFVSPELRFGREPTIRATINVGYTFVGRR
jgi:hypothetical protein